MTERFRYLRTKTDLFVFYRNMEIGLVGKKADYYRSVSKRTLHRIGVCKLKDEDIILKTDCLFDAIDSIIAIFTPEHIVNAPYVQFKKNIMNDLKVLKLGLKNNVYEGYCGVINFVYPNGLPSMVPVARLNTDTWQFEEL